METTPYRTTDTCRLFLTTHWRDQFLTKGLLPGLHGIKIIESEEWIGPTH